MEPKVMLMNDINLVGIVSHGSNAISLWKEFDKYEELIEKYANPEAFCYELHIFPDNHHEGDPYPIMVGLPISKSVSLPDMFFSKTITRNYFAIQKHQLKNGDFKAAHTSIDKWFAEKKRERIANYFIRVYDDSFKGFNGPESSFELWIPVRPTNDELTLLSSDLWSVKGEIIDERTNVGIKDLVVSLYDKDLIFDDALGTVKTNSDGSFELLYRTDAFADFFDKKPDIYLKVFDPDGQIIYSTRNAVRCEAGREEYFTIKIQ